VNGGQGPRAATGNPGHRGVSRRRCSDAVLAALMRGTIRAWVNQFIEMVQYTKEERVEAYCVKCRDKREVKDPKQITMKNGKPAVQGKCPVCGTTLNKIGATLAAT
jgi:Domain of unknown function (DUF5679)